jgi:hypothetical protein
MKSDTVRAGGFDKGAGAISDEAIIAALETVRARIAQQEQQRADLNRLTEAAREEERLLLQLLDVRRGGTEQVQDRNTQRTGVASLGGPIGEAGALAIQAVIEELTAAGRPLHISELMRLLKQRRVPIPGAGTQANVIIHLRRDERLVRPSRGMYGLAAWGLENMLAGRRRRKKRVRVTADSRKD